MCQQWPLVREHHRGLYRSGLWNRRVLRGFGDGKDDLQISNINF